MLRVTLLVPYPFDRSPGQRFRIEQWLRLLPEGAVRVEMRPLFSAAAYEGLYDRGHTLRKVGHTGTALFRRLRDLLASGRPDVVVLYREAFPLGPPVLEWLAERRYPVVYDFDDAIFLGATSEANRRVSILKTPGKTRRIIAGAAVTTVGNSYLAEYARSFSDRVEVIPTTLDIDEYRPTLRPPRDGPFTIGWSGSPTTASHLSSIRPALLRVIRELPARLDVVGAPAFTLDGATDVAARPWSREREQADVGRFDVGIMPLPDDDWSRGKCGFKALLYMALGVPTIVSPVGVNTEIVVDGVNGLFARTEDEWVDAIRRIAEDADLRNRLVVEGRQTVVERYSGQEWAPRFLAVLERAAASRSSAGS